MKLRGLVLLGTAVALICAAVPAQSADATDAQARERVRARIEAERTRIEAQFTAQMAECQRRFVVTACVDEARQRRRDALAAPRAEGLALDDIERRERAVARRALLLAKQREAGTPAAPALPASAPLTRVRPSAPAASAPTRRSDPAAAASAAAADAQQRAAATRERQAEIEATQARIRARQAERLRESKVSAPLPLPVPVPAASR